MVLGYGWLLNGDVKFLAAAVKRDANGSPSSCRQNTPAPRPFGFPRGLRVSSEAVLEEGRRTGKRMETGGLGDRSSSSLLRHQRACIRGRKHSRRHVDRYRV